VLAQQMLKPKFEPKHYKKNKKIERENVCSNQVLAELERALPMI
jgi:hypothetical protein